MRCEDGFGRKMRALPGEWDNPAIRTTQTGIGGVARVRGASPFYAGTSADTGFGGRMRVCVSGPTRSPIRRRRGACASRRTPGSSVLLTHTLGRCRDTGFHDSMLRMAVTFSKGSDARSGRERSRRGDHSAAGSASFAMMRSMFTCFSTRLWMRWIFSLSPGSVFTVMAWILLAIV